MSDAQRTARVGLDRYGHLLPGSEERVTDALEAMAQAAKATPSASVVALDRRRA